VAVYIALLRGVNVGGRREPMKDLKNCFESLGCADVRTYIQSGNVVFEHSHESTPALVRRVEGKISNAFGFQIQTILRTKEALSEIVDAFPFSRAEEERTHVTFLASRSARLSAGSLEAARSKSEKLVISGREVYLYCPDGYGVTKLSNSFLEKQSGVPATTRNWRTVLTLKKIALS